MRPAKWEYAKRIEPPGKLAFVERYLFCGKHANPFNRQRAQDMGYTVREL